MVNDMKSTKRRKTALLGLLAAVPLSVRAGTEVYVPLGSANAIAVVDAESDRIVSEIAGINASHGLAVSVDGAFLLAGSLLERPVGAAPPKPQDMSEADHAAHHSNAAQVDPKKATGGEKVGTAYLVDAREKRLLRQIDVPSAVHHALVMPDGRFAVLTHPGGGGVSVVDILGHRVYKEIATGAVPNYAISKRDGSRVYASNAGSGTIAEINTADWTVVRNLQAGKTPEHIVLSPDERYLYVANPGSGTVSRLDLDQAKVTATYSVGEDPHGVDLSDDGRLLYASSKKDNRLVAFNLANGEEKAVPLAPEPYHITTIRGTGKVYVSSRKSPKIWVLDQQTLALRGEIQIRGEGHEMSVVNR